MKRRPRLSVDTHLKYFTTNSATFLFSFSTQQQMSVKVSFVLLYYFFPQKDAASVTKIKYITRR